MPIQNLMEYSDAYSITSRRLLQSHRDEAALDNNNKVIDFPNNNNSSA